jgi:hypothetical protein
MPSLSLIIRKADIDPSQGRFHTIRPPHDACGFQASYTPGNIFPAYFPAAVESLE